MIEALQLLASLRWSTQPPKYCPLPEHVERVFVKTEHGDLELLISRPKQCSDVPPVFFAHGGYGSARVWLEFMEHLHHFGYSGLLYAYSFRNHGASYTVSFFDMVYRTSLDSCVEDLLACFECAKHDARSDDLVVVGHSSGGGLLQYALARGVIKARALVLLDAIPHFGSYGVYWNWLKTDPWFPLRNMVHFQHPTSPLSSDRLVHQAFFGHKYPMENVPDFRRWMPAYESMGWPLGMFGDLWAWWKGRPRWLDTKDIVANLSKTTDDGRHHRVCIVLGAEDMMIDVDMCRLQAAQYRQALNDHRAKSAEHQDSLPSRRLASHTRAIEGAGIESFDGVELAVIEGAGHHVQNDIQSRVAAHVLHHFFKQV
jgi:pimeloyl-ACP methyl ester carboxylesterase